MVWAMENLFAITAILISRTIIKTILNFKDSIHALWDSGDFRVFYCINSRSLKPSFHLPIFGTTVPQIGSKYMLNTFLIQMNILSFCSSPITHVTSSETLLNGLSIKHIVPYPLESRKREN